MSTFRDIDVCGALESAGIKYRRSGNWIRCKAVWRDSREDDLAINVKSGGWKDFGGTQDHGTWAELCERIGIYNPSSTATWTESDRAAWRARKDARAVEREGEKAEDESRRMKSAMALWGRAVFLDHPTDPNAAAMRYYIEYRGLRMETIMQVARAGHSNGLPCLVYGRRDPHSGEVTTIHREWDKRTWPKDEGTNKRGLGPQFFNKKSAYIEFNSHKIGKFARVVIAEGQLTAACGAELYLDSPVLAFFTAGGLENPPIDKIMALYDLGHHEFLILADANGMKSATECVRKILMACPQAVVRISAPPLRRVEGQKKGEDWLDVRVGYEGVAGLGDDATRELIKQVAVIPDLPQPEEGAGAKGTILPFTPWREIPRAATENLPTLQETQDRLRAALPAAIEAARAGRPVLISTTPGSGKTHHALKALLTAQVSDGERTRPLNFLWASPTKDLAGAAWVVADEANCGRMMFWDGRQTPCLCLLPEVTQALMEKGRSPHQHACQSCPHGQKPEGDDPDERCQFQKNLSEAPSVRGIFGQHGIVGRESTLLKFTADPRDDFQDRDLMVIDEGVPTFSTTTVTGADISAARVAGGAIEDHVRELRERGLKKQKRRGQESEDEARFTEEDYSKALAWGHEIAPALDKLAVALVTSAGKGLGLHPLDATEHADFVRLGQKIPKAARVLDATALEKVVGVFGQDRIVPLAWIKALARAIEAGTAWRRVQRNGVDVIGTNPTDLWTRYLTKGGILLDATCTHADEIQAAGGLVIDLRCAQPHLKIVQVGPRLHGKGDSGRSESGREKLAQEAKELRRVMGDDPDVVVITHKALARFMNDDRVRGWGKHKGHNDWKKKPRLILWGLPLMNANDQIVGYKTYRAAMAARGIDLPDWNGERSREWVATDGWEIMPAAGLPSVKEARDWLLRELNADVLQAIGRLRAVWATEPVTVEIYGFLPITGFGLKVDEMRLERSGRVFAKTKTTQAVASGVIELGEQRTRAKLVDYVHRKTGIRISNATADGLVDDIRVQALQSGITLDAAARAACGICTRMLNAGHTPAAVAQAAIGLDLPGVVAVASLLDQCRRTPGAQRAGP